MNKDRSKGRIGSPVVFALAVAVFGVLAMLIVDHGPWSKPHLQTAEIVDYPSLWLPRKQPVRRSRRPRRKPSSNRSLRGRSPPKRQFLVPTRLSFWPS
jgi:hypothetical protein